MDVDVECFDATDAMVDGFDLVLQLEDNGNKSLNNAVMAGAPGLHIWDNMQHLLKDRWCPQQYLWGIGAMTILMRGLASDYFSSSAVRMAERRVQLGSAMHTSSGIAETWLAQKLSGVTHAVRSKSHAVL